MGEAMSLKYTAGLIAAILAICCVANTSKAAQVMPGCLEYCGEVAIPYPFGIGEGCYLEKRFSIDCNVTDGTNFMPFLSRGNINITEIFADSGQLQIPQFVGRDCYTELGSGDPARSKNPYIRFPRYNFTISSTNNSFFAIGCDTYAIIRGYSLAGERLTTGCMSICDNRQSVKGGSCSGVGCCEAKIPAGLVNQTVRLSSYNNHSEIWDFNPCSYAFTVQTGKFNFAGVSSFRDLDKKEEVPMIVDWSVGTESCSEAKATGNVNYCNGNSTCMDSKTGVGYLCRCFTGYQGNPYHPDGCQDIDECTMENRCNGTCTNTPGSYNCSCSKGYTLTDGTLCLKNKESDKSRALIIYIPLGVSIGVVALVLLTLMLCLGHNKRKLIRQKEKFFEQNGGLMLQRRLLPAHQKGSFETAKIFSEEELIRATNNYQELIGEGGYGTVYKGTLPNNRVVAIKKPKIGAQTQTEQQTEQFINEVILLMQINHKNVVKLLGCCLDTEVPILVYEFITNGTLYEKIHKKVSEEPSLSWGQRLKIAAETAAALSYLHSETNTPILHRDIKTMNILLDQNYTAKVADFGTSRLVPLDQDELSTLVQGTIGYLDPEYLQTSQLNDKSDVYSFGVVLAELITGKKALSFLKSEGTTSNLAMSFLSVKNDDELRQVVDKDIVIEENMGAIREAADLTKRCLRIRGDERPTMKEVTTVLEGLIRATSMHIWNKDDEHLRNEETEYLLGSIDHSLSCDIECGSSGTNTGVYDSMQSQLIIMTPYNDGR